MKILLICAILINSHVFTQSIDIEWQTTIGGNALDITTDVIELDDGNLILLGSSYSDISGNKSSENLGSGDLWVVKTNSDGDLLWDKSYGGSSGDGSFGMGLVFNDKIYILTSSSSDPSELKSAVNYGLNDLWLVCLDLDGTLIWDKSYGGDDVDFGLSILVNNSGNLILGGRSSSNISGNKTDVIGGVSDYWVIEVDIVDGSIIKQKSLGGVGQDLLMDVETDADGNLYLIGSSEEGVGKDKTDPGFGGTDFWIVKLDSDFNIVNDFCFGGTGFEYNNGKSELADGNIYILGASDSPESGNKSSENYGLLDGIIIKLDTDLNLIWDVSLGGLNYESPIDIQMHNSNQLIVSVSSDSGISGNKTIDNIGISRDIWLLILDDLGNINTQTVIGGGEDDTGFIHLDSENNIIVAGASNSGISGDKTSINFGSFDYWVLKLNASDYLGIQKSIVDNIPLNVYPNPFNHLLTINFTGLNTTPDKIMIYDINGSLIDELTPTIGSNNIIWNAEQFDSGIYTYRIILGSKEITGKVVKLN